MHAYQAVLRREKRRFTAMAQAVATGYAACKTTEGARALQQLVNQLQE